MLLWQQTVHRHAASGAAVHYALLARPMRVNTLTAKSKKWTKTNFNLHMTWMWRVARSDKPQTRPHICILGDMYLRSNLSRKHVLTFAGKFADCRRQSNKRIFMLVAAAFAHFPTSRSDLTFVKFILDKVLQSMKSNG